MFTRMVIGECLSDAQVEEAGKIYRDLVPDLLAEPGYAGSDFLVDEDGYMAILVTEWLTREDCIRFHGSRTYRQYVSRVQHLLAGDVVVKMFHSFGTPDARASKDPVCGTELLIRSDEDYPSVEKNGVLVFFCSTECQSRYLG